MQWIEASVETKSEEIDAVCAQLAELGAGGMVVEDEADFRRFLEQNHQYWDYVDDELADKFRGVSRVKFYLSDDDEGRALLESIRTGLGREIRTATVADSDWENNWRQYYEPIEIGELRLDPGLIFGTGSHATTKMCLAALERYAAPGKTVLDLGCGSGILAIGALLLGCECAVGCDIDPKAPEVAESNAALNGIGPDRFRVYAGDVLTDAGMRASLGTGYDIVTAPVSEAGRRLSHLRHHRGQTGRGRGRAAQKRFCDRSAFLRGGMALLPLPVRTKGNKKNTSG